MTRYPAARLHWPARNVGPSFLVFVFAASVVGFGVPVYSAEVPRDVPTPAEIVAAYGQNFASLLPIAVTYEIKQIEGIGLIEADRMEVIRQQSLLSNKAQILEKAEFPPDVTLPAGMTAAEARRGMMQTLKQMIDEAPKQLEYLAYRLKPENVKKRLNEPRRWRFQWWCDQKSFHVRWPKHQGINCAKIDSVKLDAGPITPESLEKNYGLVQMISRCAKNNPPARFWYGTENSPRGPAGEIGSASLRTMQSKVLFPPLGTTIPEWAVPHQFTHIDQFMSQPLEAYHVVGETEFDGRKVILMDCDLHYGFKPIPKRKTRARAWIDPRRGFIPIRLEYDAVEVGDSGRLQFPASMGKVKAVSEVDELREVHGSFYPVSGKRQEYVPDARWEIELYEKKESSIGKVNPNVLPGWSRTWRVTKLSMNASVEPGALELVFPDSTVYLNTDTNQYSRVGTPQDVYERQIAKAEAEASGVKERPATASILTRIIVVNGAVLVALVAVVYFWRKGRRS